MGEMIRVNGDHLSPIEHDGGSGTAPTRRFEFPRRATGSKSVSGSRNGQTKTLDPSLTGREAALLETNLKNLVVGQDEAISQIVNIYQMHMTGLNAPQRPVGSFLFLGPTGSGKTRIVEATAESLVGSTRAVIKIDCAEFQHSHEIAKLIGSPPGYLGHRETHPLLSQEVINQYHTDKVRISFILFDEIEKASDSLWNLLLGILDKATLTLGDNRKVDFSRAMIFMTSNLGSAEISNMLGPKLGFAAQSGQPVKLDDKAEEKLNRSGIEAARRRFSPEFMNRLDKVVVFKPLAEEQLRQILDIELSFVQQRIFFAAPERGFVLTFTNAAKNVLLKAGTDLKYGARHLKRAIERMLVQPMSNLIATEQICGGDLIIVGASYDDSSLTFVREAEGLPVQTMAEMADVPSKKWIKAASSPTKPHEVPTARSLRRG